jgi:hypothetical protein
MNVSTPKKRALGPPPESLRERHEWAWKSPITLERQRKDPNPLAADCGQSFIMDADPPNAIPSPLWEPGRGKAAGSKRHIPFRGRR